MTPPVFHVSDKLLKAVREKQKDRKVKIARVNRGLVLKDSKVDHGEHSTRTTEPEK